MVKQIRRTAVLASVSVCAALAGGVSHAEITIGDDGIKGDYGKVQLRGRFSVSAQGAIIDPIVPTGDTEDGRFDGSARLSAEYTTDNAIIFGIEGEIDSGNDEIEGFERDELYVYLASDWGRVEIGENDGPADTLSFHAPTTGLGQVRGDFARYQGTIALLSPYDTRDAAKVTYLSPPAGGFRGGVSYSPEFNINENDPDPTRRLLQEDVVEIAGQYNTAIAGTAIGVSAAYVTGTATGLAGRGDIESWSIGTELTRGDFTLGAAYVDEGLSNLPVTTDARSEWNAGLIYRQDKWSVAASTAVSDERGGEITRYGVGGIYQFDNNIYVASDVVFYREAFDLVPDREATVGLVEVGIRY